MNSTDEDFSGTLTRDKWVEWYKTQFTEEIAGPIASVQRSLTLLIDNRASRCFEYISDSFVIREKFFTLSEPFQKELARFAIDRNPIPHIEEFVNLTLRLEAQQNVSSFAIHSERLHTNLRPLIRSVSDDFDRAFSDFRIYYPETSRSLCRSIVLSLALLYDGLLVERVLQQWTSGKCPGSPTDFANIVEYISSSEDEEILEYPIEWLVNVFSGSDR